MRTLLAWLACGSAAWGAWIELRPASGPVVVLTDAGDGAGRAALLQIEQYRHILGASLGQQELTSAWPIVIVVQKNPSAEVLGLGRAAVMGTWKSGSKPGPAWWSRLGQVFLEGSLPGRMPRGMEEALLAVYSTLEVQRTQLTVGVPPPAEQRTPQWALLHMLATDEATGGRLRVLLSNLAQGADEDGAFRNAFAKRRQELEEAARVYLKAGRFEPLAVSGQALDPERFKEIPASPTQVKLIPGDLLLAQGAPSAAIRAAYQAAVTQGALGGGHEGLGLAALMDKDEAAALAEFTAAVRAEGAGPRAWCEHGRLVKDAAESLKSLEQAIALNPKWAEPHVRIAERSDTANKRAFALQRAATVEPRNRALCVAAAEALEAASRFDDAVKMWRLAARSVSTDEEREALLALQRESQERREEAAAAERRRKAEAERAELDRLRNEALARIKEAEAKANAQAGPAPAAKPEAWWDGPPATAASGIFERLDCLGKQARMVLKVDAGKTLQLLIPDAGKVVVMGGGERTMGCGAQRPPRSVKVEYTPKPDAKLGVAGVVVSIEFP